MNTAHARLSPSNLRWPHCPGSIREEAVYPDVAGEAAIDGTGTHLLLELCLIEDVTPDYFLGRIIGANHEDKPSGWMVEGDRIECVKMALNYINRRRKELLHEFAGAVITVESESKSDPGSMYDRNDWKGTCDVTISAHVEGHLVFLETIDYKDGRGWVTVKGNSQLIAYTGGKLIAAHRTDVHRPVDRATPTRMTIVQPKTNPPVRYEDQPADDIYLACDRLAEAAAATDDPDAPLIAGKHCQWCKHKPNCTAQAEESTEVLMTMSEDVKSSDGVSLFELMNEVIKDLESISSEKLRELADARPGIEAIFDRVDKELFTRLENGGEVDGYELKPGRSTLVWALSEEEMVEVLKARRLKNADIYPPKLASPAQVLKLASLTDAQKERLEKEYVLNKPGALKLTRVGSRKTEAAEDIFKDVQNNVAQCTTNNVPSFL